ncbi:hypothetical protein [Nocardia fluminea]|uniref:hypothetical protein n=1 Tax=Nocardia fluminea TaxID=134984 RepID=UPI0037BB0C72
MIGSDRPLAVRVWTLPRGVGQGVVSPGLSGKEFVVHFRPALGDAFAAPRVVADDGGQAEAAGAVEKRLNGRTGGGIASVETE